MHYDGIIITGTSCAGKSSIAEVLCANTSPFFIVKASTTRAKRTGDTNFNYFDNETFNNLAESKKLLVHVQYRNHLYGILVDDFVAAKKKNKIPVLVVSPEATTQLLENNENRFMSFFIDVDKDTLADRFQNREHHKPDKLFFDQLKLDRKHIRNADYSLINNELLSTVDLIKLLWEHRGQGGALSHNIITKMIKCGLLLEDADCENIKGASYDLSLGDEYYYAGKIKKLTNTSPFLTIEPYDYAIVSCKEKARLPRDVIAKFGLTVSLFCQGIILSNGPQIDPGFRGTLFCLLFNTSNRAVHLKRGKHYATIEFNKLLEAAPIYSGQYQDKESIIEYIPANALHGAINELKKEIEQLKNESKLMQNIYLGVVSLMFAVISVLLVLR